MSNFLSVYNTSVVCIILQGSQETISKVGLPTTNQETYAIVYMYELSTSNFSISIGLYMYLWQDSEPVRVQ